MTNVIIPAGPYRLDRDVENPTPDRRRSRDWRAEPTWEAGSEFVVHEQRRDSFDDEELAKLPEEKRARIEATRTYTVIEMVGQSHPSLRRIGPGHKEQYATLAAALVPCAESLDQFMARLDCSERFARWLVERGAISRADFERWWQVYQHGDDDEPDHAHPPCGDDATTLDEE